MLSIVKRVFRGSVPALASHLIDSGDLTLDEIRAIRRLLDEKARELRSKKP
jgi:predicted transcriptional regulator